MTTWTEASRQSETWTQETEPTRTFSRDVFSHQFQGGKRVFALGSSAGLWDKAAQQSEVWTPK